MALGRGSEVFPDGNLVAYTVDNNDGPGRPYGQLWVMDLRDGHTARFGEGQEASGSPEWSPDGQWIAYSGAAGDKHGVVIAHPDASGTRFLADAPGTNSPVPYQGRTLAWSPDGKQIAFVASAEGPETRDATGDPMVITRYLYKPDCWEGNAHFNDNRRLHIFVADVATGQVQQLTDGHRLRALGRLVAGRLADPVRRRAQSRRRPVLQLRPVHRRHARRSIRRLTGTESVEFSPRWSPDGRMIAFLSTKRGLTDRETTMEDTHVWVMNADGSNRREIGGAIDNRQLGASGPRTARRCSPCRSAATSISTVCP